MNDKEISKNLDEQIKDERLKEAAAGTGRKARFARHVLRRKKAGNGENCPEGHEYDEQNTLYTASGARMCLKCLKERRIYPDRASDRLKHRGREVINLNDPENEQ